MLAAVEQDALRAGDPPVQGRPVAERFAGVVTADDVRALPEHDRVAFFVAGLNALCSATGLLPLGTELSVAALRLVALRDYDEHRSRVTVDAAHYVAGLGWLDGADHRRATDPAWAEQHWGAGRRRAGNARLPGEGPTLSDDEDTLRRKATRGTDG